MTTFDTTAGSMQRLVRRRRVIYVPEDYVLALLSQGMEHGHCIRCPRPLGLPDTARMVGVWSDYARGAFALVVQDATFEEVPEGVMLPEVQVQWTDVEVAVKAPNAQGSATREDGR